MPTLERREDLGKGLDPELRARLRRGEHEAVAGELAEAGKLAEAGWVLEQIWDFAGASARYLDAGRLLDALRAALEDGAPATAEAVYLALEASGDAEQAEAAAALLTKRRRHREAARVLEIAKAPPTERAAALERSGDRLAAANALAESGMTREALEALGPLPVHERRDLGNANSDANRHAAQLHALAASLCWDLGDAEAAARHCQEARRAGAFAGELGAQVRRLLARALASLGHDLAAQLVLAEDEAQPERSPTELASQGRYRVTGTLPAVFAGAAYVGVDRVDLQEIELHLLLAEYGDLDRPEPAVLTALDRFAAVAVAADALAHPAIRPILRLDAREGLLVMPRREGPILRNLIRPPGLAAAAGARARSLIAFMLDALARAHAAGLTHGSLFPSQIVCDALGRPLLGPFGAHHLAGLVATRTGGLDELLAMTPPEQRAGAPASQAGDIYMLGALWAALSVGRFTPEASALPAADRDEIARWMDPDPDARPPAHEALARIRTPIGDLSQLAGDRFASISADSGSFPSPGASGSGPVDRRLGRALTVVAADSWTDHELDLLCTARNPWLQNILDREGRRFQLAAWPSGCRTLEPGADWRALIDARALELLRASSEPNAPQASETQASAPPETSDDALRDALTARLDSSMLVVTPAGELMLALDKLLPR